VLGIGVKCVVVAKGSGTCDDVSEDKSSISDGGEEWSGVGEVDRRGRPERL